MSIIRRFLATVAIAIGLTLLGTAHASNYQQEFQGKINSIDFIKHTITVNNHTYAVSPKANFNGAQGFGVLTTGLTIQYFVTDEQDGSQTIIEITIVR